MSLEGMERMAREQFKGARPRVFGTDPDHPARGRIFVWTPVGWFERIEGPWGDVTFDPVAESENELKAWLARDNPDFDLVELTDEFGRMVFEEFLENTEMALYPEAPETSSEPPFEDRNPV